jgi:hypothetical protein
VEPRDVAGRNLQIEDAQRSALKDLAMMRFLMNGHDWRLAVAGRVSRLPRHGLTRHNGHKRRDGGA